MEERSREMKMAQIREIAKQWHVSTRVGRTKKEIIQEIQVREGFTPCFGTRDTCGEWSCLWMEDCLPKKKGIK
jgi:hypothetical protein